MKLELGIIALALAVAGCDRKDTAAAGPAPKVAAGAATASPAAMPTPAPAAAAATTAQGLFQKLGEQEGVVFAETKGGTVEGIAEGTRVAIVQSDEAMAGQTDDLFVTVKHGGKTVKLPADRVITHNTLNVSSDGKHAVFFAIMGCGDYCHSIFWMISSDGRRTKLGEGGADGIIAWHPAGSTVAISSSGGTWLVNLADHHVTSIEMYSSPAYAPDGTLYLRKVDGSAYTYVAGEKPKRVWKPKKKRVVEDDVAAEQEPSPVKFVNGKPKFELEY